MAFNGYLVKILDPVRGDYIFPTPFIEAATYKVVRSTQDLDSYRDADAVLHRTALAHKVYRVDFTVPPNKTNSEIYQVLSQVQARYTNVEEKKLNVQFYVPETDTYVTCEMYVPDLPFTIRTIKGNIIYYEALEFNLISY